MKKYSLYIITIPLAIIIAVLFLWLFKEETVMSVKDKQWIEEYLKKASQEQENINYDKEAVISSDFKCPEDYASIEDYIEDTAKYIKNYQIKNPDATEDEILEKRYDELVSYNCQNNFENSEIKENPSFDEVIAPGVVSDSIANYQPIYHFEDYSANDIKQAPLNLKSHPRGLEFKTAISNAYKEGPNFAGHYTVVEWGCGANCQSHVIVDNRSGNIIDAEIGSSYGVEYKLNSRLFVVNPPEVLFDSFGDDIPQYFKTKYYELTKDGLKLRELGVKENPSFDDVIARGCCIENCSEQKYNPYLGKKVQWKAMVSDYAHTDGIRFIVIDENHTIESYKNHGLFYGTFLASASDPRLEEEGSEKWSSKWNLSWVEYIMDVYGNIRNEDRDENTVFSVTANIDYIDCDKNYDRGYIETSVEKVEIVK